MKDDEKKIEGADEHKSSNTESGDELEKESTVNFIMCNEYGVDLEKSKVPLLESSEGDSVEGDNTNFSLNDLVGWNDEDYEDRHTTTLLVLGIIIAAILSYCIMITVKINKVEKIIAMNDISVVTDYSDSSYKDVEIDVLKNILTSKVAQYGYSQELMSAIYYVDCLKSDKVKPYESFVNFAKAIEASNITLLETEYNSFAYIMNHKIYEFIGKNSLSQKDAEKVGVLLQRTLSPLQIYF